MVLADLPFSLTAAFLSMLRASSRGAFLSESSLLLFLFEDQDAFPRVIHWNLPFLLQGVVWVFSCGWPVTPILFLLPSVCQVTSPQRHIWETQNPCLEWFSQASVQGEELGRQQSRGGRNKCDSKEGVKKVPWGWNSMWEVSPVLGHRTLADAFIQAWVEVDLRCVVPCVIKWILHNAL